MILIFKKLYCDSLFCKYHSWRSQNLKEQDGFCLLQAGVGSVSECVSIEQGQCVTYELDV